jgi:hypothetical protein
LTAASKVIQILLKSNNLSATNGEGGGHRWTLIAARADLLVAVIITGLLWSKRAA